MDYMSFIIIMFIIFIVMFVFITSKLVTYAIFYGKGLMLGILIKGGIVDKNFLIELESIDSTSKKSDRITHFICQVARNELK